MAGPYGFIWIEQGLGSRLWYIRNILGLSKPQTAKTWEHSDTQWEDIGPLQYLIQLLSPMTVAY